MPASDVPYAFIPWYAFDLERIPRLSLFPRADQYARASFAAVSTASEPPPEVKNTRASGIGAIPAIRAARARAGGLT